MSKPMTWLDAARMGRKAPPAGRAPASLFPRKGGTVLDLKMLRGAAGRATKAVLS